VWILFLLNFEDDAAEILGVDNNWHSTSFIQYVECVFTVLYLVDSTASQQPASLQLRDIEDTIEMTLQRELELLVIL